MDLTTIVCVEEVSGAAELNRYLDAGWVYLTQAVYDAGTPDARIVYSVGWSGSNGPVFRPEMPARKELN